MCVRECARASASARRLTFDSGEHGKEFVVVTVQPRVPAGYVDFCEIPAGMV